MDGQASKIHATTSLQTGLGVYRDIVCARAHVPVRACARACVRARVCARARGRAGVRARACVRVRLFLCFLALGSYDMQESSSSVTTSSSKAVADGTYRFMSPE
eukprot:1291322-Amphidinium_carterae.2